MGLISGGATSNLKHSTFDLTVGEIIPIGKDAVRGRKKEPPQTHYLEPREMVWILSKEEFRMPSNVTGLATLRTTFTKNGILALNVGIIDPFFEGPISTALINFSDRPRPINVGEKFFRVVFLEHQDVTDYHERPENKERLSYIKELETVSYADFSPSFLNVPNFNDEFYKKKFWSLASSAIFRNKTIAFPAILLIAIIISFLFHLGLWQFIQDSFARIGDIKKKFSI